MKKIILDLCGGTGSWSKPYKEAGYDIRLITLPREDVRFYTPPKNVYGILAAPPCTMFSIARTTAKTPRDLKQGMELVISCLNIIWNCRYENKLAFWALENPRGYLRQFLGKPILTFDPYEYGDPYKKKTDIWGYFNIPNKKPVNITKSMDKRGKYEWGVHSKTGGSSEKTKRLRSITPSGFANAFFKSNK